MSNSYLSSNDVTVFPAGFRAQEYAESRLTTETNLSLFRQLSAYQKYNNYFTKNPYDATQYIIGIKGYLFIINSLPDPPVSNPLYAFIKLRTIPETDFEVLDNIETSGNVLDTDNLFQGIGFTTDVSQISSEYYVQIWTNEATLKLQPLKLSSYEIADKDSDRSLAETLDDVTTVTNNLINLNLNGGTIEEGIDTINFGNPRRYIHVGKRDLEVGLYAQSGVPDLTSIIEIKGSSTKAEKTVVTFPQSFTFPAVSETANVALVQYAGNSNTLSWKSFAINPAANSLAARDAAGGLRGKSLYADDLIDTEIASVGTNGKLVGKLKSELKATSDEFGFVKAAKVESRSVTLQTADITGRTAMGLQIDSQGTGFTVLPAATTNTLGGIKAAKTSTTLSGSPVSTTGQIVRLQCDNSGTGYVTIPPQGSVAIPSAGTSKVGGIKTGFTSSDSDRNYGVKLDDNGNAYVHVPWQEGGGSGGGVPRATADTIGGIKLGFASASPYQYPVRVDASQRAYTQVVIPLANVGVAGLIKVVGTIGKNITSLDASETERARILPLYATDEHGKGLIFLPIASADNLGGVKATKQDREILASDIRLQVDKNGIGFIPRTSVSDIRLKENIADYIPDKSILDLPLKRFDFIDGNKNQIGCIAQDLQKIYPELVSENIDGYLEIDEIKLIYPLIAEVKSLRDELYQLRSKLNLNE